MDENEYGSIVTNNQFSQNVVDTAIQHDYTFFVIIAIVMFVVACVMCWKSNPKRENF